MTLDYKLFDGWINPRPQESGFRDHGRHVPPPELAER